MGTAASRTGAADKRWAAPAAAAAAAALLALSSIYLLAGSGQVQAPVRTIQPVRAVITRTITASGEIQPENEVNLKSRISGVLDQLYVTAGQAVKAGDTVARIRLLPDPVSLNAAESQLQSARISLANSEKEFGRAQELFRRALISEEEYQRAATDRELQRAQVTAVENELKLLKGGSLIGDDGASNLIRATIDGIVLDLPISPGQYVSESNSLNEGSTIGILADVNKLMFRGDVSEADVNELREAMLVTITVSALRKVQLQGTLNFIAPRGILRDGSVKFEIRAPVAAPEGSRLRPGFSATGDITIDRRENVIAIPESVVRYDSERRPYVLLLDDSERSVQRPIELGLSDGFQVEVVSGLDENEKVIVSEE